MMTGGGPALVFAAVFWLVVLVASFVWMGLALGALLRKLGAPPAHAWVPVLRWMAAARAARMSVVPVAIARCVAAIGIAVYITGAVLLATSSPDIPAAARLLLAGGGLAAMLGSLVGWVLWIYGSGTIEMRLRAPAALSWLAALSPVIWASVMGWGKYGKVDESQAQPADAGVASADGPGSFERGSLSDLAAPGAEPAAPLPVRPVRYGAAAWGTSAPSAPSAPSTPAAVPAADNVPSAEPEQDGGEPAEPAVAAEPAWESVNTTAPVVPSDASRLPAPVQPAPGGSAESIAEPTPATNPLTLLPPGWAGAPPAADATSEPALPTPVQPAAPIAPSPAAPPLAPEASPSDPGPVPDLPAWAAVPAVSEPAATLAPEPAPDLPATEASAPEPAPDLPAADVPAVEQASEPQATAASAGDPVEQAAASVPASGPSAPSAASAPDQTPYAGIVSPYLQAPQDRPAAADASASDLAQPGDALTEPQLPWAVDLPALEEPVEPVDLAPDESRPDTWEPWTAGAPLAPPPGIDEDDHTVIAQRRKDSWMLEVAGGGRYLLPDVAVVIGRSTAGVTPGRLGIEDPTRTMSKVHAELAPADGGWTVRDLGSTNGTYVRVGDDERQVDGDVAVAVDGVLLLGDLEARIVREEDVR
jgi:hypothetical protein